MMPSNDSNVSVALATAVHSRHSAEVGPDASKEDPTTSTSSGGARKEGRRPWGLAWRSSVWFITFAVGLGVTTDLLVYSMIVPVIPFRLQSLGYQGVSGLVGWLLFAYSAALVASTGPIAYLSERYKNRRIPLLCGLVALIGAQIMLMEAPTYWVMILARLAQGISSSVITVVGLALVCDTTPEAMIGKQIGLVMMGMPLGMLVGAPVAGALDQRFGFRGPFIFGVIITVIEFACRLLIIERHEAERWEASLKRLVPSKNSSQNRVYGAASNEKHAESVTATVAAEGSTDRIDKGGAASTCIQSPSGSERQEQPPIRLSIWAVMLKLLKSSRAMAPVYLTLTYGIIVTSQEPALPLYLQAEYGLDVSKVGLVYIASVAPSFVSAPLSGWYADRGGTILSTIICLVLSLPFYIVIAFKGSLTYFIAIYAVLNFFVGATISPVTAELAKTTQSLEGVGYAHVYGAFNIAYGIGSAVGPVIGGQLYDHISQGWMVLALFGAGMLFAAIIVTICFFGEQPLLKRVMSRNRSTASAEEVDHVA